MWKFIRPSGGRSGGGAQLGEQRLRAVREALDLKPTSKIGFPYKPTALAHDPASQMLAVGTGGGEVYVFGAPGVEFVINHHSPEQQEHVSFLSANKSIRKIIFLNAETKNFGAAAAVIGAGSGDASTEFDRNSNLRVSSRYAASAGLKPRLITLCADDTLHLWLLESTKDGKPRVKRLKTIALSRDHYSSSGSGAVADARNDHSSSMCTTVVADEVHGILLVGTERGQLLELSLQDFRLLRTISSTDIARLCPEMPRGSLGAVESIVQHPKYSELCLIGYSRGLVVVYNVKHQQVLCFGLVRATELEDTCWCTLADVPASAAPISGGDADSSSAASAARIEAHAFITSHNDGSYQLWDMSANGIDLAQPTLKSKSAVLLKDGPKNTPFGPFPCKAINRVAWLGHHFPTRRTSPQRNDYNGSSSQYGSQQQQRIESLMVFNGGMQNNGPYSDQNTVSVVRNKGDGREEHVCFDCTSRVVDFLPISIIRQPPPADKTTSSARSASVDKIRADAAGRDAARGQAYAGFSLNRRENGGGGAAVRSSTRSRPANQHAVASVASPVLELYVAILLEEELVIIDLNRDVKRWADLSNPYLVAIHSSAVTCFQLYDTVSSRVWRILDNAYRNTSRQYAVQQPVNNSSSSNNKALTPTTSDSLISVEQAWPLRGGMCVNRAERNAQRCLLITGHEDGVLRLWDVGGVVLRMLMSVKTACYYAESDDEIIDVAGSSSNNTNAATRHGGRVGADAERDSLNNNNTEEAQEEEEIAEDWPVRKLGRFDPFSDDPRFCIQRVLMCVEKGIITAAGTAGQVLVFKLAEANESPSAAAGGSSSSSTRLNLDSHILSDAEGFVWKGHKPLTLRARVSLPGSSSAAALCRLTSVVQLHPPAACSALAVEPRWGLLAVGTAHGMALVDYARRATILIHCTLSSLGTDLATGSDTVMSRRKSFKKSLRESFRRMRHGRSSLRATHAMAVSGQRGGGGADGPTLMAPGIRSSMKHAKLVSELEARAPMERQVESRLQIVRTEDDGGMSSVVRTLKFVYANLMNSQVLVPTLWLGTNNGTIAAFTILVPQAGDGGEQRVTSVLCREIQLRHHAPVVGIEVVDSQTGTPMNEILKYYNKRMDAPSLILPGDIQRIQLVVISEEQLKAFSLPHLRPYGKYKLTALDGALIRRAQLCQVVLETQPRAASSLTTSSTLPAASSSRTADSSSKQRMRGGPTTTIAGDVAEPSTPTTPEIIDEQWCVSLLTNLGDIRVLTVPSFQPIVQWQLIAREDLVAISGLKFTSATGRGIFQCASSQFQRFSLFAPSTSLMDGSADTSFGLVRFLLNSSPSTSTTVAKHSAAPASLGELVSSSSLYNNGGGDSGSSTPVEDLTINMPSRAGADRASTRVASKSLPHYPPNNNNNTNSVRAAAIAENGNSSGNSSSNERVSNASSCETLTNAPSSSSASVPARVRENGTTSSSSKTATTTAKTGLQHGHVAVKLSAESGLGSSMSGVSGGERLHVNSTRGGAVNGISATTTHQSSSANSRVRKSHRETAIN